MQEQNLGATRTPHPTPPRSRKPDEYGESQSILVWTRFSYGWSGPLPQVLVGTIDITTRGPSDMLGLGGEVLS